MSKRILILAAAALIISSAAFVAAQTTTTTVTPTTVTKTVQNPDGTYTVIEYPVGKEVKVILTPVSLTKSKAAGTILRDKTGTSVVLNLTDVPKDVAAINVYAVDDAGVVTLLGPVVLANGAGQLTAVTELSKFMLIAVPDKNLTTYDPKTTVFFRSAVPEGFAVIPQTTAVVAVTTPTTVTAPTTVATTATTVTTTPATVTTVTAPAIVTTPTIVTTPATVTTPAIVTAPAIVATPTIVATTPTTVTAPTIVTTTPTIVTAPTTVATTATTVTKTVQNPDGTYTIVEYPVGKEVQLNLTPVSLAGAKAVGTILRDDAGTRVILNLTDVPAEVSTINVYAVDDAGVVTLLGPVALANGAGKFTATTPLSKFMLIAAPDENLTTYGPTAKVYFRSAVPEGFAVIPFTTSPVGETVAATTTPGTTPASTATVPMLNIPAYKKGDDTKLKVDFTGAMAGARANIFIEPHKNGAETEVKMVFHELKDAPKGQAYILWAVSPDNQFFKLGQIVNVRDRNEAEIKANTSLADFGLLVTMEDLATLKTVIIPGSHRLGVIHLMP